MQPRPFLVIGMDIEKELHKRLKEKSGMALNQSSHFSVLVQAISDTTGEKLAPNTVKRIFGFNIKKVVPRRATLDILARYLGFTDFDNLLLELGEEADISAFSPVETVDVGGLADGATVKITYDPNRTLTLKYLGNFRFSVEEAVGSKNLKEGDVLIVSQIAQAHRFVASHVYRDGEDLGAYEAAKSRGISQIEVSAPSFP